jgi:8-oxo-dGTP pyrophosphatase MutT (NUDIX family)
LYYRKIQDKEKMAKCDRHIDTNDFEWCWKCQELTDKERFSSFQTIKKPKEMKVIFLDNDGVICLSSNWGGRSKKWAKYRSANPDSKKFMNECPVEVRFDDFDKKSITILNEILEETGAEIVVSSDWRFHANLEELGEYYTSQGISKKPIGITKKMGECNVPQNFIWSRHWELEQSRSLEILQYLQDHPEVTEWVAVDDLNMGIPQNDETWGEMEMDWGLTNFVLTPKSSEGIKQSGIKEKIIKYLIDDTTESNS